MEGTREKTEQDPALALKLTVQCPALACVAGTWGDGRGAEPGSELTKD